MSDKPLYLELTILVIAIRFLCVTYLDVLQPAFDHGAEQLRFMDCGSFLLILKSNALIDEHWWIQDKKTFWGQKRWWIDLLPSENSKYMKPFYKKVEISKASLKMKERDFHENMIDEWFEEPKIQSRWSS